MAKNTFRQPPTPPPPPRPTKKRPALNLGVRLNNLIPLDRLFGKDNDWPIQHFTQIMWATGLLILYIYLNHNAERYVRWIQRAQTQVSELRSQVTVLQADFDKSGKQSEISRRVSSLGLTDSQTPPYKLVVRADEH